jgi:hypothetical protein
MIPSLPHAQVDPDKMDRSTHFFAFSETKSILIISKPGANNELITTDGYTGLL